MSTVLEVAGLAALAVGVFLLCSVPVGLMVAGALAFAYAQTVNDDLVRGALARLRRPVALKPDPEPEPPSGPPRSSRNLSHTPPPWPKSEKD